MSVLTEILISSLLSLIFTPQEITGKTTTTVEKIVVLEQVEQQFPGNCITYKPEGN